MKVLVWTERNLPQAHGRGRLESWWILEPTAQGTHGCPLVDDWWMNSMSVWVCGENSRKERRGHEEKHKKGWESGG